MRAAYRTTAGVASLLASIAFGVDSAAAANCESLAGMALGDAAITSASSVSPPFSVVGLDPPRPVTVSAPFCRVEGTIRPSPESDIRFELWLPPASTWNGKYAGVGNGGFAGSIIYSAMSRALEVGFAVSGTDTGHVGSAIDAHWALGHPEKVVDFGWRGIHEVAMTSKAIVRAYYGSAARHAYFSGCSDGGREALMEAQRFPADYDGIVAGAPANNWTRLVATAVWDEQALVAEPGGALPAAKLPAITDAVLGACNGRDGFLDDPSRCRFDPSVLLCKGGDAETCLTAPQLTTLRKIYAGPHDSAGDPLFPGVEPGSEAGPAAWSAWITGFGPNAGEGSLALAFGRGFFGDIVFGNPNWDFRSLNFDSDLELTEAKTGKALNATDADLGRFKAAGGKLIQYHGWNDAAIPPASSVHYYQAVAAKMGGMAQTKSFYRLFMAPGMQHCGGGNGPNAVGGVFGLTAPADDAAHDVLAALAHWVEEGVASEQIVATKFRDDDPAKGIAMQRPWCAYPTVARYSGHGSRNDAANYNCAALESE